MLALRLADGWSPTLSTHLSHASHAYNFPHSPHFCCQVLDRLERRIRELEAERKSLRRSAVLDRGDAEALNALETELKELRERKAEVDGEREGWVPSRQRERYGCGGVVYWTGGWCQTLALLKAQT